MRNLLSLDQRIAAKQERNTAAVASSACSTTERHYTVRDVAAILSLSVDKARRMFENEPGVLVIADHSARHKRRYKTLRIPESVLQRVIRRMTNV